MADARVCWRHYLEELIRDGEKTRQVVASSGPNPKLGNTSGDGRCPHIWELSNDIAGNGQDLTETYQGRLPDGVSADPGERLIITSRSTAMIAAKVDIPDVVEHRRSHLSWLAVPRS